MNEYCISFLNTDGDTPVEVFHCHVEAPGDQVALELAFHGAVRDNVRLSNATAVRLQVVLHLPADVMAAVEALRHGTNGAAPTPTAAASHLH